MTTHEIIEHNLRKLYLEREHKEKLYSKEKMTDTEELEFERAISEYLGEVKETFKGRVYEAYDYSLKATDETGTTMFEYLRVHGSFKDKRASSFSIK